MTTADMEPAVTVTHLNTIGRTQVAAVAVCAPTTFTAAATGVSSPPGSTGTSADPKRSARRRGRVFAIAAAALMCLAATVPAASGDTTPAPAPGDSATALQQVSPLVAPSIVYLTTTWTGRVYDTFNDYYLNDGEPFQIGSACTGFVVNPDGYIATAGHCVQRSMAVSDIVDLGGVWAHKNRYYANASLTRDQILGFAEDDYEVRGLSLDANVSWGASVSGLDTAQEQPARVLGVQAFHRGDTALLRVNETGLNAVPLNDDADIAVGTEVVAVGYPGSVDLVTDADYSPSFKSGAISSVKTTGQDLLTVYEIDAAISPGMSGGPTVNVEGEVVGTNSFLPAGETQPFNFISPSQQTLELLADAGVTNELSQTTRLYRQGVLAYFAGDKQAAVSALRQVIAEQPSNAIAGDMLQRANALADPAPPPDTGATTLSWVLGSAALALLLVAAGGLWWSRRRRAAAPASTSPAEAEPPLPEPVEGPEPAVVTTAQPGDPVPAAAPVGFSLPMADTREHTGGENRQPRPAQTAQAQPSLSRRNFCSECGSPITGTERFCGSCGTEL